MNLIGQGFDGVKNLFDFSDANDKDKKKDNKKKLIGVVGGINNDTMSDPLFKKV